MDRAELVERLAAVSHATWLRQKSRDQGIPLHELDPEVGAHDRERAEDTMRELEALGVLRLDEAAGLSEPGMSRGQAQA
jgi:hypothetical protein